MQVISLFYFKCFANASSFHCLIIDSYCCQVTLKKSFQYSQNATTYLYMFFRYWPYLKKVVQGVPELQSLTEMLPFLSVMHAKAHTAKCEVQ